jgi:site-specific recombinase XerD
VLESAKLGEDAGGLYKLRHTFALRQLRKGKSEEDVARWLGLLDISSMVRYRRIVISYQDVV